ncbi:MAG TPA: beta-ketoacyl-ACP synthase II [Anaerolineae bacterium]|nr:beta-ketoacyl-ACP synthase II [Anaerolineae bacterium]
MSRRMVVTGMGILISLGHEVDEVWTALLEGRSGVRRIQSFDPTPFDSQIAAEVRDFDAAVCCSRKEARRLDRFVQYALYAADRAVADAGLKMDEVDAERVGVLIGSGKGGTITLCDELRTLDRYGPERVSPFLIPMMICDMASAHVAMRVGAKGPNFAIVSACCTSAHSIGEAAEVIRRGDADVMIAGGSDASLHPICVAGFTAMRALSRRNDDPVHASRPFDAQRDGFVIGEGSGVLVLESAEHAQRRGARIYGELLGYGATADAHHITAPVEGGDGLVRAIRIALNKAGLAPEDVHYVNAHGTSTPLNDRVETLALKGVFGEYAYDLPVSSTKSMTGHLLGASGAVEAIFCLRAINDGIIPPTINYEYRDPACDLNYVPNQPLVRRVDVALSNSAGFGGHNASLIFGKWRNGHGAAPA